jgi:hypothetical protein
MLQKKSHLVLLIGDEGTRLSIHEPRTGNPNPQADSTFFAAACDEPSEKQIIDLVARHARTSHITILLDTLAQDYRVETVPRMNAFDRARIIRRRLTQFFPEATATAAIKLDSSRVGFAGWSADGRLRRWLDALAPYAPRVALLPIEGASVAPRDEWTLIISLQRTGGLRQIVTNKGHPVFARHTPSPSACATPEAMASAAVQECCLVGGRGVRYWPGAGLVRWNNSWYGYC